MMNLIAYHIPCLEAHAARQQTSDLLTIYGRPEAILIANRQPLFFTDCLFPFPGPNLRGHSVDRQGISKYTVSGKNAP